MSLVVCYSVLAAVGVFLQRFNRRFRSMLVRQKHADRSDIVKFAFTFGKIADMHLSNFMEKQKTHQMASSNTKISEL